MARIWANTAAPFDLKSGAELASLLCQQGAAFYPASWDTVADEELPLLDRSLAATAAQRPARERMAAMVSARRLRREAAFAAAAAAAFEVGLDPMALIRGTIDRRAARRFSFSGIAEALSGRRRRDLRGELLLHAAGLEALALLETLIDRGGPPIAGEAASHLLEHPAAAAAASLFAGFNAAYLVPCHAYQAGALAAAAWLGWRLEGRHAPLPVGAASALRTALAARDGSFDACAVLRLGLDAAGIGVGDLDRVGHEQWPSPRVRIDLRPRGVVDAGRCEMLRALLRSGADPC